jgi:hypothetical protein
MDRLIFLCYDFVIIAQTEDYHERHKLRCLVQWVLFRISTYARLLPPHVVFRNMFLFSALLFIQLKVKSNGEAVPMSHRDGV